MSFRSILFLLCVLPVVLTAQAEPATALTKQKDLYELRDVTHRVFTAQILHVDDQYVYFRNADHITLRRGVGTLDNRSKQLVAQWKEKYGRKVSKGQIRTYTRRAKESAEKLKSERQPFLVNPDTSNVWVLDEPFSDEFDGKEFDTSKWSRDLNPWGERVWTADNVQQKNGILTLHATYEPHTDRKGNNYFYKLGIVQSKRKTTYGYFEARIKACARFPGLCPAFWLYSNGRDLSPDHPHITYSEIDIVELLQDNTLRHGGPMHIDCNLHTREMIDGVETWRRPQQWPEVCKNTWLAPWDPRDDFHLYACENTPEKVTWYIDGVQVAESPNHNWHLPMNLTLTMELRPPLIRWAGEGKRVPVPEAATADGFPTHMEVDYVRSWTLAK